MFVAVAAPVAVAIVVLATQGHTSGVLYVEVVSRCVPSQGTAPLVVEVTAGAAVSTLDGPPLMVPPAAFMLVQSPLVPEYEYDVPVE